MKSHPKVPSNSEFRSATRLNRISNQFNPINKNEEGQFDKDKSINKDDGNCEDVVEIVGNLEAGLDMKNELVDQLSKLIIQTVLLEIENDNEHISLYLKRLSLEFYTGNKFAIFSVTLFHNN